MRVLLSPEFKRRVRFHRTEAQGALGASVGIDQTRFSSFMHDRVALGRLSQRRIERLGARLGLTPAECFREVNL
jgi:hypothetical protein